MRGQGRTATEQIFHTPPFICVEILSKDDTMESMQERIDDYLGFGVPFIWVINPRSRRGWIYTKDRVEEVRDGILRAEHIEVPLAELFAE
jgi:Uma2 family endonuclease